MERMEGVLLYERWSGKASLQRWLWNRPGRRVFLGRWNSKWRSMCDTFLRTDIRSRVSKRESTGDGGRTQVGSGGRGAGEDQVGPYRLSKGLAVYPEWEGKSLESLSRGWHQLLCEEIISSRGGSKTTNLWGHCKDLGQGSANLFLKEATSKYFWLRRPYGLCGNYSSLTVVRKQLAAICKQMGVARFVSPIVLAIICIFPI